MEVIYKCKCMPEQVSIKVRDRDPKTMLGYWMNIVTAEIGYDHHLRSPKCELETMEYCMIPACNEAGIGVPETRQ